jgi:hypothetical protein
MAKKILTINNTVIPYEGELKYRKGVRERTPHTSIEGVVRFHETLENSETKVLVSVRSVGDLPNLMEEFYRTPFNSDGTGALVATIYDPDNATATLETFDSGFLADLPEQTDQELVEYSFCFRSLN